MLGHAAERRALHEEILTDGWRRGQIEFVRAVFDLAVRRWFGTTCDPDGIRELVAEIPHVFTTGTVPSEVDMAALVRAAIGDSSAAAGSIELTTVLHTGGLVTSYIVQQLQLTNRELDRLIVAGEDLAVERGWQIGWESPDEDSSSIDNI